MIYKKEITIESKKDEIPFYSLVITKHYILGVHIFTTILKIFDKSK